MLVRDANAGLPLNQPQATDRESIQDAARRLEASFAKMLIGSMRTTSMGDSAFPGASEHYRDMYDQQLADTLTRGKGLGLQPMIARQLGLQAQPAGTVSTQKAMQAYSLAGYTRGHAMHLPVNVKPALAAPLPVSSPEFATARAATPDAATAKTVSAPATASSAAATQSTCGSDAIAGVAGGSPQEKFIAEIWPHAQKAAAALGVCPKVLVAQAALETGWGQRVIRKDSGENAYNLFGIKAGRSWGGESVTRATREVIGGRETMENAAFRAYGSAAESFGDYVALLKSPRYAGAVGQSDSRAYARALQQAGYATDPQYAAKITAIVEGPTLNRALARLDAGTTMRA